MADELPKPHVGMTPEDKCLLLLEYVRPGKSVAGLDFSRANLKRAPLPGANLSGTVLCWANLRGANLSEANLSGANLSGANLSGGNLRGADLRGADLTEANLSEADLSEADLTGVKLRVRSIRGANLERTNLSGADLGGADLGGANLTEANLSEADLGGVNLGGANLGGANLRGANLRGVNLTEANFSEADLGGADLGGADLTSANLRGAFLEEADLSSADLTGVKLRVRSIRGANLERTNLSEADLGGVNLGGTSLVGADVSNAKLTGTTVNLDTVRRSHLDADTLRDWKRRGARFVDFQDWPTHLLRAISGYHQGLTLFFNTRLTRFDRFLVDGVIVGLLGRDTDVEVAEFRQEGERTIVRLTGEHQADLELVADALWHRVWDEATRAQRIENNSPIGQQINVAGNAAFALAAPQLDEITKRLAALQAMGGSLDVLRVQLDRMELRLPSEEANAMLDEEAKGRQALELVASWDLSDDAEVALARLLERLLPTATDLRRLLSLGVSTTALAPLLPGGTASPAQLAWAAARAMSKAGVVEEVLGRLKGEVPGRVEEIEEVLERWRACEKG
ncbi:MAG: pentapeptide repeat-containing protein [Alphaproteobacteria bacterium]|nr:pentapeptide repeat-containing protein [Alphaproteobacteria bacterium]